MIAKEKVFVNSLYLFTVDYKHSRNDNIIFKADISFKIKHIKVIILPIIWWKCLSTLWQFHLFWLSFTIVIKLKHPEIILFYFSGSKQPCTWRLIGTYNETYTYYCLDQSKFRHKKTNKLTYMTILFFSKRFWMILTFIVIMLLK